MKILNNWPKKILALLIAFILWLYVFQTGKTKRIYTVAVEIRNAPAHLISTENFRTAVGVEVEGEKALFNNFNPQNIQCVLDLGKARKGRAKYIVRLNQAFVTTGLTLRVVDPYIAINFEEIVSKKVRVLARTEGVISNGYTLKDIEISPTITTIIGPESVVKNINRVYTQIIDIQNKFSTFETDVIIDKVHDKIQIKDNNIVNVKIIIIPQLRGRIFKNLQIKVFGLPQRYKVAGGNLTLEEIEIQGPLAALDNLKAEDISPFIVITNVRTDIELEVKVHIAPIRGFTIIDHKPKIIKIRLSER